MEVRQFRFWLCGMPERTASTSICSIGALGGGAALRWAWGAAWPTLVDCIEPVVAPGLLNKVLWVDHGNGDRRWGRITEVELAGTYNLSPEVFLGMLKERNLKAISGHFSYDRYRDDAEGVAKDARKRAHALSR